MLNHQTAQMLRSLKLYGMADALEHQLSQPQTYDLPETPTYSVSRWPR